MAEKSNEFVISRVFDAPRHLVFSVWTEREHLMHWWGPKGVTIVSCNNDLRPGGIMHYGMRTPDGNTMWGKWIYREIVKPERIVFINCFSDASRGLSRHPLAPNWPQQTLSTIAFNEHQGKTKITVRWSPFEATDVERKTFADGHQSMQQGWTGTLDQLTDYLTKATKE